MCSARLAASADSQHLPFQSPLTYIPVNHTANQYVECSQAFLFQIYIPASTGSKMCDLQNCWGGIEVPFCSSIGFYITHI